MKQKEVIIILGPTASGKSAYGVALAKKLDGEVISADSRQIYRGMDIGTGKITKEEMNGIIHHMIDIVDPQELFTVGDFKERATQCIEDIQSRGKTAIVVGGTGLYLNALLQNYELPPLLRNEQVQKELEEELKEKGEAVLYQELIAKDPESAQTFSPKNHRYLIRALEIVRTTGKKKSELAIKKEPKFTYKVIGIHWDADTLAERINTRHRAMFDEDRIIEETRALLAKGYTFEMESMTSIGYKEVGEFLGGKIHREEMIMRTCAAARQYAKRQRTWFRRLEKMVDIEWKRGEYTYKE